MAELDLVVVGINHRSGDVELREKYAVASDDLPGVLSSLTRTSELKEAAIVSTCNRVEVYVVPDSGVSTDAAVAAIFGVLGPQSDAFYVKQGFTAAHHLFRVCASLDSMVIGEPQILGQVKEAYALARRAKSIGPTLRGSFDGAFRAAKLVRTHTGIARSAVSVGHVGVELAKAIFGAVADIKVLLIGAGKMGVLAAQHLADSGARQVWVTNRTFERAEALASRHGWAAKDYTNVGELLEGVDVVICSTGSPQPVLTFEMVRAAVAKRRYRSLFLIDIAVPRDIEVGCGQFDDVYLYNIDDLEEVSRTNTELRWTEMAKAETMLQDEIKKLETRLRERSAAPVIQALQARVQGVAKDETTKTLQHLGGLDDDSVAAVQKLAQVVANRLTRGSIEALKQAAGGPEIDELVHVIQRIFELESDELE